MNYNKYEVTKNTQKTLVIDALFSYNRIALLENEILKEIIVEEQKEVFNIGDIIVGKIKKILPKKFAFIDIGDDKNAFLGINDRKQKNLYSYNENTKKHTLNIKEGQDILVQVDKAGTETKGTSVTSNITITGKYSVLLLNETSIAISNKITDCNKISFLKNLAKDLPIGYGVIFRTNSENAIPEDIVNELQESIQKAQDILNKGRYVKPPSLLHFGKTELDKLVTHVMTCDDKIITNSEKNFEHIKKNFQNISLYDKKTPIFEYFDIESKIEKAMQKKVWLKNGGFLIIEQVEAMTVIDVNTGKNTSKNFDKMVFDTNKEAVKQIAHELRLRNISGMVLIDFIDMKNKDNINEIECYMRKACRNDRMPIKIYSINELGIMQLTRKKLSKSLYEIVSKRCPSCGGDGMVRNEMYIVHTIKNQIISIFTNTIYTAVTVYSNSNIINKFKKYINILEIENEFDKVINLEIISTGRFDYFEIKY